MLITTTSEEWYNNTDTAGIGIIYGICRASPFQIDTQNTGCRGIETSLSDLEAWMRKKFHVSQLIEHSLSEVTIKWKPY